MKNKQIKQLNNVRIKNLRKESNYTINFVAKQIGVCPATIRRMENNPRKAKISHLVKIANLYNVSNEYVLGFSNNKKIERWLNLFCFTF